jgi:hypothetical protein
MKFTVLALGPAVVLFAIYVLLGTPGNRHDPYLPIGGIAILWALVACGLVQRYWRARITARGRIDASARR